jgi:hypothetical protein
MQSEEESVQMKMSGIYHEFYEEEIPLLISCIFEKKEQVNWKDPGSVIGFSKDLFYLHKIILKCLDDCFSEVNSLTSSVYEELKKKN